MSKFILFFITITFTALTGFIVADQLDLGNKPPYVTSDIDLFWKAADSLQNAKNNNDSLRILQTVYLDHMSKEGQKFIEVRKYTAAEYLRTIRRYPRYLKALRKKTDEIARYKAELDTTFKQLKALIPDYETPRVCFAIGCFRGGGTTKKELILMGSEIALADSTMDFSEFKGNLKATLAKGVNLAELVAHESIHCQQHHAQNRSLLSIALQEGAANFLPSLIFPPKAGSNTYELAHECELWQEFKPQVDSEDLSQWFFNTSDIKNRPPDLGYFVGMQICASYYHNQTDKQQAIRDLLDRSKYREVLAQSGYDGHCATLQK